MFRVRLDICTSMCAFWIFINFPFVFLSAVGGQTQVVGSHDPVIAAPGDDIVLTCLVDPKCDIGGKTVEWSKLDLEVNPADPSYVYLYRNRREDVVLMFPSYVGRTKLSTEALKEGNILLLIKNVTLSDNGQYRCFIPDLKSNSKQSVVTLVVDPNYIKTPTTETQVEPVSLQTLEPNSDMGGKVPASDQRSHVIPLFIGFSLFLVLVVGFSFTKMKHQPMVFSYFLFVAASTTSADAQTKIIPPGFKLIEFNYNFFWL